MIVLYIVLSWVVLSRSFLVVNPLLVYCIHFVRLVLRPSFYRYVPTRIISAASTGASRSLSKHPRGRTSRSPCSSTAATRARPAPTFHPWRRRSRRRPAPTFPPRSPSPPRSRCSRARRLNRFFPRPRLSMER
eukprot:12533-Pelagococcus_subviridis.AAC.4